MKFSKADLYLILLTFVMFALVGANEMGYGAIALLPGLLLAYWFMIKAFSDGP